MRNGVTVYSLGFDRAFMWVVMLCIWLATAAYADQNPRNIVISTHTNTYQEYETYTRDFDPLAPGPVKEEGLWRHLAEVIVFTIAPVLGGCECRIVLQPLPANATFMRGVAEVNSGRMMSFPIATFPALITDEFENITLSEPVLRSEDFFVGLYTHEARTEIISLSDPEEIRALRFGVGDAWQVDNQVLRDRGFTIVKVGSWESLMQMLEAGRIDVVMQPFSKEPDMAIVDSSTDLRLLPIPGVKMHFPHDRRYMVNNTNPDGLKFLEHLNKGLRIMRENGLLQEYMTKAGVLDPRISEFKEL